MADNGVTVTLIGRIGQDPVLRTGSRGDWASFTVATSARYKQGDTWVDGPTSWFGVNADGELAHHVVESLVKGQQVIVHGTVSVRESAQQDGSKQKFVNVQASAVGPDLKWGTARFTRAERPSAGAQQPPQQLPPAQQQPAQQGGDRGEQPQPPQQQAVPAAQPVWGAGTFADDVDAPF